MNPIKNLGDYAIKGKMTGEKSPGFQRQKSKEEIQKIRNANLNRKLSPQLKEKMSLKSYNWWKNNKDNGIGQNIIKKLIEARRNYKRTPEGIKNHSQKIKELYKEGILKPNKTSFKNNHIPWNRGIKGYKLNRKKGLKLTLEQKEKVSKATRKGMEDFQLRKKLSEHAKSRILEKSPGWRGGISFETYSIEFNERLKKSIRLRDNFRCKICKKDQNELKAKLSIHHIDYNKKNNNSSNLVALCNKCHLKTNGNRTFWTKFFQSGDLERIKENFEVQSEFNE